MNSQSAEDAVSSPRKRRRGEVPGKVVVAIMFTFGVLSTGALWTYWFYHTQPFIPLQVAISAEFKGSAPRVDGGARKLHKGTPKLLWIIMRVDFRPDLDREKSATVSKRVVELSQENLDLTKFEQLNIRLFFGELEKEIHTLDAEVPIAAGQPDFDAVTAESLKENAKAETLVRPSASPWPKSQPSTEEGETDEKSAE